MVRRSVVPAPAGLDYCVAYATLVMFTGPVPQKTRFRLLSLPVRTVLFLHFPAVGGKTGRTRVQRSRSSGGDAALHKQMVVQMPWKNQTNLCR